MLPLRSMAALAAFALAVAAQVAVAHDPAAQARDTVREAAADAVDSMTGTVNEITVVDATRGTAHRYVDLELADGTLVPLQGTIADSLGNGARVEVRGRHRGRPLEVETIRSLGTRRAEPKALVEIDGTLAVLHADYFAEDRSAFIFEVHDASGNVRRLRMASTPPALEPGVKVRVHGRVEPDNEALTPERITVLAVAAPTSEKSDAMVKAATANSVLVIMANFNNTAAPAFSAAQAQQVMSTNTDSVANFFRETSYGQQIMNVTVTGWVTMNMAQPASCGSSDWRGIGTNAEAAARALGAAYDPATYNFVVYVFPTVPACGWLGLGYISYPHKAWINGISAFRTNAIAHEMGHNFGLLHAASLRCNGVAIGGSCTSSEYGDPFDTMGNKSAMHYNAMQKAKLSWIPSTSVRTHTGGLATYTLSPLEVAGGSTYAVKIPTGASSRTYWLEFRQPIGFDRALASYPNNGAQVRVAYPFETQCSGCDAYSDDTQLLDMTPGTSSFNDATLPQGQTFSDPAFGINVTVLSATASALTVQVGTGVAPPPAQAATSTALSSTMNPALTGSTVTITATVTGNAPTGSIRFTDNGATIGNCSAVPLAGSGNARAAACVTNALVTGSHAIVASYAGDGANLASSSAVFTQTVNAPVNGTNVALASNGGVATASSTHDGAFGADGVNDNRRSGAPWGNGGGWNDNTPWTFQDWVQINFNGRKTIDHVVVYTLQDNYLNPAEPTDAMTFSLYGISDFQVQGFDGTSWVTLGSVTGNTLVKRTVSFAAYTTDRIRVLVTGSKDGLWSRITEVEAWTSTAAAASTNYALASNGSTALASSTYNAGFAVSSVIDNRRTGAGWGNGGGWNDLTTAAFPDWVQINFNAPKTIDHVVVYTIQDNVANPVEPTESMTFSLFGITAFDVQAWNGATWVTLGSVRNNRFVKRTVSFTPFVTSSVRIVGLGAADGAWCRITEIEAWGS